MADKESDHALLEDNDLGTIDLPPPRRDDDDGDDAPVAATPEAQGRPQRGGGRGGRMAQLQQEIADLRSNGISSAVNNAVGPLQAQLRDAMEALQSLRQERAKPAEAPQVDQKKQIVSQMQSLMKEASRSDLSQDRRDQIASSYHDLNLQLRGVENDSLRADIVKEMEAKYARHEKPSGGGVVDRALGMLEDEYPEFFGRDDQFMQRALAKVRAYVNHEVDVEERPKTLALYREAAAKIKAKLGLGESPPPTRDRQALLSTGRGGGPGGGKKNGNTAIPKAFARGALNATGMSLEELSKYMDQQSEDESLS